MKRFFLLLITFIFCLIIQKAIADEFSENVRYFYPINHTKYEFFLWWEEFLVRQNLQVEGIHGIRNDYVRFRSESAFKTESLKCVEFCNNDRAYLVSDIIKLKRDENFINIVENFRKLFESNTNLLIDNSKFFDVDLLYEHQSFDVRIKSSYDANSGENFLFIIFLSNCDSEKFNKMKSLFKTKSDDLEKILINPEKSNYKSRVFYLPKENNFICTDQNFVNWYFKK